MKLVLVKFFTESEAIEIINADDLSSEVVSFNIFPDLSVTVVLRLSDTLAAQHADLANLLLLPPI